MSLRHDREAQIDTDPYDIQGMPVRRCQGPKAIEEGFCVKGSVNVDMSQKLGDDKVVGCLDSESCVAKESCTNGVLVKEGDSGIAAEGTDKVGKDPDNESCVAVDACSRLAYFFDTLPREWVGFTEYTKRCPRGQTKTIVKIMDTMPTGPII